MREAEYSQSFLPCINNNIVDTNVDLNSRRCVVLNQDKMCQMQIPSNIEIRNIYT